MIAMLLIFTTAFQVLFNKNGPILQINGIEITKEEIIEYYVSGEKIQVVDIPLGYTHNIINLSQTEDLVTFMWANECFDPNKPDTFFEVVE